MKDSKIEWTNHTFNPWWGCEKVSAGCKNCYAAASDSRWSKNDPHWGPGSTRRPMGESYWYQPVKWNAAAAAKNIRERVFCASMADVFEGHEATIPHLQRLFKLIEETPNLDWLLLTKRPENIMRLVPDRWHVHSFPGNVWIGTSVENQEMANLRIPQLLKVPAAVRFLSCEPLLGPLDLSEFISCSGRERARIHSDRTGHETGWLGHSFAACEDCGDDDYLSEMLHWIIVGGETGKDARPMSPDWVTGVADQCKAHGIPFFFKQWGDWTAEYPQGRNLARMAQTYRYGYSFYKVGKENAGNLLNGELHQAYPHIQNEAIPPKMQKNFKKPMVLLNTHIQELKAKGLIETNEISDGYHTFGELYDHRIELYISLCQQLAEKVPVWRSLFHSDGSCYDGWFILGVNKDTGTQISYHLPNKYWDKCDFAEELHRAPEWDGHSGADVLSRLAEMRSTITVNN